MIPMSENSKDDTNGKHAGEREYLRSRCPYHPKQPRDLRQSLTNSQQQGWGGGSCFFRNRKAHPDTHGISWDPKEPKPF